MFVKFAIASTCERAVLFVQEALALNALAQFLHVEFFVFEVGQAEPALRKYGVRENVSGFFARVFDCSQSERESASRVPAVVTTNLQLHCVQGFSSPLCLK